MNIPIITAADIVIREPEPAEHERQAGYRRVIAMYHREEVMYASSREASSLKFSILEHARDNAKQRILNRLYPAEIRKEIDKLIEHFCCSLGPNHISHIAARELYTKLGELADALDPKVK